MELVTAENDQNKVNERSRNKNHISPRERYMEIILERSRLLEDHFDNFDDDYNDDDDDGDIYD